LSTALERLASHVEILKRGSIDVSTATRLLALSRQIIENDNSRSKYPTINLYGDWSVHNKLDRKDAQRVLAEIDEAFRIEAEQPGHFDGNTMARAISPRKFEQELGEFLKAKLIDPSIGEPQYLVPILRSIMQEISTKPLELPEAEFAKRMKEQRSEKDRIQIVKSLVIEPNQDPQNKAEYRLRAIVYPNPPVPNMPGFQVITPFILAKDEAGNIIA
jgi:hypothetical protein